MNRKATQKAHMKLWIGLAVSLLIVMASGVLSAYAATYYVDASVADDSGDGMSPTTARKYIKSGISLMSGGDTLYIADGEYTSDEDRIEHLPDGGPGNYTRILANNDWGVTLNVSVVDYFPPLNIKNNSYIEVRGIKLKGGWSPRCFLEDSDHIKIIRCCTDNGGKSTFLASNCEYVLFEECFAYGEHRYAFQVNAGAGFSKYIIFRRCLVRWDGASAREPLACFANYDQSTIYYQNCIAIDGMEVHNDPSYEFRGMCGFKTPNGGEKSSYRGCIVLNIEGPAFYFEDGPVRDHYLKNCIAWDLRNNTSTGGDGDYKPTQYVKVDSGEKGDIVAIDQCTFGKCAEHSDNPQPGIENEDDGGKSLYNSIIYNTDTASGDSAVYNFWDNDYNCYYGNDGGRNINQTMGANSLLSIDPLAGSLECLVRIEDGSILKTSGQGGEEIGATVLNKIGDSGTLYGESGWDSDTYEDLWPFPNEDMIREECRSVSDRGFCADGMSLTKYIWEYLGNSMPDAPSGLKADIVQTSAADSPAGKSVMLTWHGGPLMEKGFIIERKQGTNGTFQPLAQVDNNKLLYEDANAASETVYYYRVKAQYDSYDSGYSNEAEAVLGAGDTTVVIGGSSGGGGMCFIATAAFGSALSDEVIALERMRDEYLLNRYWGKIFVGMYYFLSPPCAAIIKDSEILKKYVRLILQPLIVISRQFLAM